MGQGSGPANRVGRSQGSMETSTASRAGEGAWWSQIWASFKVALSMRKGQPLGALLGTTLCSGIRE